METRELFKLAVVLFLYGVAAPLLGLLLKFRPRLQWWVFGLICFMTIGGIAGPVSLGPIVGFFEYRGHTKGYHFYWAEVLAIALIVARALEDWRHFRLFPPGLWLYFLYCAVSFISIVNAPAPSYVGMAAFRYLKTALIFVAAYNFLRSEKHFRFFLGAMCLTMGWEFLLVLKLKYWDWIYQVPGTFEHQNSLSTFTTMIAMVFLAAALAPKHPHSKWYLAAYLACAFIQESTLSRGGLVVFAAGSLMVAALSILDKVTARRVTLLSVLCLIGALGLGRAMDTIMDRFLDRANESSLKTRELLNQASLHMLSDYPLGIGWNNYGIAINEPFPYGRVIDDWERQAGIRVDRTYQKGIAESHYSLLLAETGYQGLAFYLLLIAVFLYWNLRAILFYRNTLLGSLSLGIAVGCGSNYLQSILERVLTQPRNMMLWMLLLAMTARIELLRRADRQKRPARPVRSADFAESQTANLR